MCSLDDGDDTMEFNKLDLYVLNTIITSFTFT